jgi:hypothetical protein
MGFLRRVLALGTVVTCTTVLAALCGSLYRIAV